MKEKIFGTIVFIVIVCFVTVNTFILSSSIGGILEAAKNLDVSGEGAEVATERLYDEFKRREKFINLTVNHENLASIEECFCEIIGYLRVDNTEEAEAVKYRLIDSLEHLRRLSGVNWEAVI